MCLEREAPADIHALRQAIWTILTVAWIHLSPESSALLEDFASFSRLGLADFAGAIEAQAGRAKEGLRTLDTEVNEGQRDQLGRKKRSGSEERKIQPPNG